MTVNTCLLLFQHSTFITKLTRVSHRELRLPTRVAPFLPYGSRVPVPGREERGTGDQEDRGSKLTAEGEATAVEKIETTELTPLERGRAAATFYYENTVRESTKSQYECAYKRWEK